MIFHFIYFIICGNLQFCGERKVKDGLCDYPIIYRNKCSIRYKDDQPIKDIRL